MSCDVNKVIGTFAREKERLYQMSAGYLESKKCHQIFIYSFSLIVFKAFKNVIKMWSSRQAELEA